MDNYLDMIDDYLKAKNDLICFNSYSNDVRLFKNHIIKFFNSRERLEKCIVGLQIMSNTTINVPTVRYVCPEKNILVENGFCDVKVIKDLAGLDRVVTGIKL